MDKLGKKIGFIGGGQMAEAIIKGIINAGLCSPDNIYIKDTHNSRLEYLKEKYKINNVTCDMTTGYDYIVNNSDIVILAVKPQMLKGALEAAKEAQWSEKHLIVSIVGGVKTSLIERYIDKVPVVRVMPNTPMLVNTGASGISLGKYASKEDGDLALAIFKALGVAYVVPENLIDPITSVSGCGPAYVYMFIEALADGGVEMGLSREMAQTLAAQTVMGAAKMVLETGEHPGRLKDFVCSPGGATIAGVYSLEKGGFRGAVMNAVEAGKVRMEEVGKKAE